MQKKSLCVIVLLSTITQFALSFAAKLYKKVFGSFFKKNIIFNKLTNILSFHYLDIAIRNGEIHITFARGYNNLPVGNFAKEVFTST